MSEKAPTQQAQELHDALDYARDTGYSSNSKYAAKESVDGVKHDVRAERFIGAGMQEVTLSDATSLSLDGVSKSGVRYDMTSTNDFDHTTDELGAHKLAYGQEEVGVRRRAVNSHTGQLEDGTVKKLTGERAARARDILHRRAARSIGAAAVTRIRNMTDAYQPPK